MAIPSYNFNFVNATKLGTTVVNRVSFTTKEQQMTTTYEMAIQYSARYGIPQERLTPASLLQAAFNIIQDPYRWCRGDLAQDKRGSSVDIDSPRAYRFCSLGALQRTIAQAFHGRRAQDAVMQECTQYLLTSMAAKGRLFGVAAFNDYNSHPVVMEMWTRAIALARVLERTYALQPVPTELKEPQDQPTYELTYTPPHGFYITRGGTKVYKSKLAQDPLPRKPFVREEVEELSYEL